jgi:catechol 2,3-dioxygenase
MPSLGAEPYVTPAPNYRLPAATRLGAVHLEIADLARSLAYYRDILGFRVVAQEAGRATLAALGDDTPLIELHDVPHAAPHPQHGRLGLYHFAILLPTRAALGRFVAHLGRVGAQAGQGDHTVSEAFYLQDPDGLGIEVYADRPRASWEVLDNQLLMGVDPVDIASLLREAGNTAWTGMPAGTTIGHVHLHVGSIEEATAFFHRALGLDVVMRMPSALFLSAGGYHHHLGTNIWAGRAPKPKAGDARLLEWTIALPHVADAEAAARSLEAAGYPVTRVDNGWLASDPWGTRLLIAIS